MSRPTTHSRKGCRSATETTAIWVFVMAWIPVVEKPLNWVVVSAPICAAVRLPIWTVDEYAETTLAQRISMISGVAQVGVFGQSKYAVRIDVDPRKLASKGIGSSPLVINGVVVVNAGSLTGFDAANGKQIWAQTKAGGGNGSPVAWTKDGKTLAYKMGPNNAKELFKGAKKVPRDTLFFVGANGQLYMRNGPFVGDDGSFMFGREK